jgi:hypothetical protein
MPGLLDTAAVAKLQSTASASFDSPFVELMTPHHRERSLWPIGNSATEPIPVSASWRTRSAMSQQGERAQMHGMHGASAVYLAFRNMFADNMNFD